MSNLPTITSEPIALDFVAGQPQTIQHGYGRQLAGWLVVWQDGPGSVYVSDPNADTAQDLVLISSANFAARIVLL